MLTKWQLLLKKDALCDRLSIINFSNIFRTGIYRMWHTIKYWSMSEHRTEDSFSNVNEEESIFLAEANTSSNKNSIFISVALPNADSY